MTEPLLLKKCTKCGTDAPLSEFYGKNHWCRGCKRAYGIKWRCGNEKNREKIREWQRLNKERINTRRRLKRHCIPGYATAERVRDKYGLSLAEYRNMLKRSEGLCAICRKPTEKLCVDHCHSTGKVRELLCRPCNIGLGGFCDSIGALEAAIAYLKRHGRS